MAECRYCDEVIDTGQNEGDSDEEQPYLDHLAHEHYDELSAIDSKRIEREWNGSIHKLKSPDYPLTPVQMGVVAGLLVLIVGVGVLGLLF